MNKRLKITYPPKTSHQFYSLPLSIVMNDPMVWNWYYSEFTQLFSFRDENENLMLRLYNYGSENDYFPLESMRPQPDNLKFRDDVISMFKIMLKNDYYIYVSCDGFYIKEMFISSHVKQDILIYGFNDNKEVFNVLTSNKNNINELEVSYNNFYEAYNSQSLKANEEILIFYQLRTNIDYHLEIEKIKWHILDYLEGVDTLRRERPFTKGPYKSCWGIKIYNELIDMFTSYLKNHKQIDPSIIVCLYEHKKDFVNRIEHFNKHSKLKYSDDIYKYFFELKNYAKFLLEQSDKINKTANFNENLLKDIIDVLSKMHNIELQALTSYYNYNKNIFENI